MRLCSTNLESTSVSWNRSGAFDLPGRCSYRSANLGPVSELIVLRIRSTFAAHTHWKLIEDANPEIKPRLVTVVHKNSREDINDCPPT